MGLCFKQVMKKIINAIISTYCVLNWLIDVVSLNLKETILSSNFMLMIQWYLNKRPTGLNGHLSIRDFTLNSCQKGAYLHSNSPIIIINKNQQLYRKAASQSFNTIAINLKKIDRQVDNTYSL